MPRPCARYASFFPSKSHAMYVYMTQVLETVIAEQKVKAADDLSEVKVALERSQEQVKVSLDRKVDQLAFQIKINSYNLYQFSKSNKFLKILETMDRLVSRLLTFEFLLECKDKTLLGIAHKLFVFSSI